jgi:chemotaxis protein MotB
VLAEIARETGTLQNVSEKGDGGAHSAGPSSGASGGEAYRDPFAPDFWSQQVAEQRETGEAKTAEAPRTEAAIQAEAETMLSAPKAKPAETEVQAPPVEQKAEPGEQARVLSETIRAELATAFGSDPALGASIAVVPTASGVMISVMDEMKTEMFGIGSALPNRELVLAMEKIGKTLAAHQGSVTVNGHTDGRPFQGTHYDNWQLSTARAQAAYYMLMRAGLQEGRVESVAGFADRKLRLPSDPLDASNRRIEILLETAR